MTDVQPDRQCPIDALPLGAARLARPEVIMPLSFDHLLHRRRNARMQLGIVPIEAVQTGDTQVFAAREDRKYNSPMISLDVLSAFPSVRSVVNSTCVKARSPLRNVAELLFVGSGLMPDALTIENLIGLESLYAAGAHSDVRISLDHLPRDLMRQLSIPRWAVQDIDAVRRLTNLRELAIELYPADSIEPVSVLHDLTYLRVSSGKGWASLRECVNLEEAHLIDVRIANLRRWGTWEKLRRLVLTGAGLKSLAGVEQFENLENLTLIMLGCKDLEPLEGLSRLTDLTLRHVPASRNLNALSELTGLSRLRIDQSVGSDRDIIRVESLQPLAKLINLRELVLLGTDIGDGDLTPLIGLPQLRKVVLGRHLEADVDKLKAARPDIEIDHHLPAAKQPGIIERVGQITIHGPIGELKRWSICCGELISTPKATESQCLRKRRVTFARSPRF
jgi:protein phosphatase 1 regulatory subunit 7